VIGDDYLGEGDITTKDQVTASLPLQVEARLFKGTSAFSA